jgi:YHYH protein
MPARAALLLTLSLLAAGCVTVNVGQPAPSAATQASSTTTLPAATATTTTLAVTTTTQAPPVTTTCPTPPAGMPPIPAGAPCPQPGSAPPSQPTMTTQPPQTTTMPPPTGGTGTGTGAGSGTGTGTSGTAIAARQAIIVSQLLCLNAVTVDDYTTSTAGGLSCRVSYTVSGSTMTLTSTTIPSHDFESGGGCCAKEQTKTWLIPLAPVNDTDGTLTPAPERGAIAVAVNGAAIYGPEESAGNDVVSAPSQGISLGPCSAHSSPGGEFHYHADANCIHWHPPAGQTMRDYSFSKIDPTVHSPILGFAFDGYPIYGTYGWDGNGAVKEMTSSYRLKAGKTGSDASNDYEYVAGLGDLDACNGHWTRTPEFPDGIYAYHSTRKNGAGAAGYPYFLACYHGVASSSATMTMGGGGGTMPPGGGGTGGGMMPPPPGG